MFLCKYTIFDKKNKANCARKGQTFVVIFQNDCTTATCNVNFFALLELLVVTICRYFAGKTREVQVSTLCTQVHKVHMFFLLLFLLFLKFASTLFFRNGYSRKFMLKNELANYKSCNDSLKW